MVPVDTLASVGATIALHEIAWSHELYVAEYAGNIRRTGCVLVWWTHSS
jgi:hypothetical protein